MKTYEAFLQEVGNKVMEMAEKDGKTAEYQLTEVQKANGLSYYGLSVKETGANAGISLDLKARFHRMNYEGDETIETIAREAYDHLNSIPAAIGEATDLLKDYDSLLKRCFLQLIRNEGNEEYLQKNAWMEAGAGLAAIVRVCIDGSASFVVDQNMLEVLKKSEKELFSDVKGSLVERCPLSIRLIQEVMEEMMGISMDLPPMPTTLYVASGGSGQYGAGALCYPEFFQEAVKVAGDRFYILPSSIHELLLLPDHGEDFHELQNTVRIINAEEVQSQDYLSDTVYYYDAGYGKLETAAEHHLRIQNQ